MRQYKIYQLDDSNETACDIMYMGYDFATKHCTLSLDLYKLVWEGETDGGLDDLFAEFNHGRHEGYTGHSMSVSDIVELDGKLYYCDSWGWEAVNL